MNKVTSFTGMIVVDVKLAAAMYQATLCPSHEMVFADAGKRYFGIFYPEPCFTKSFSKGVILQSLKRMWIFFLIPMILAAS